MQLGAAAAATRRAPGAPAAAAPHAGATFAREQHPAAGKAGACDHTGPRRVRGVHYVDTAKAGSILELELLTSP